MGDFHKPQDQGDAILNKYATKQKTAQETLSLRQSEIELSGKVFVITKFKHMETLARIPDFMNLWFSHIAAIGTSETVANEQFGLGENNSADYVLHFIKKLGTEVYFADYVKDFLCNVTVKATGKKVDLEEDLDSPLDIIKLFVEVAKVNFFIQLSQAIFSMPQILTIAAEEQA